MNEERWQYNCTDCVRTREIGEAEAQLKVQMGLEEPYRFQQLMFEPVLFAMIRGVRIDRQRRSTLLKELLAKRKEIEDWFTLILGHPLNPSSSKQMQTLFYEDLGLPVNRQRAKKGKPGAITCDDEALRKIAQREPLLRHLVNAISDWRTLGVFSSTFLMAALGEDGRMRSSFNLCGAYTFRLSSSKDAFGSGANLENIPSDKSKTMGKAAARGSLGFTLPNIRSLYIPDPDYTMFDLDLDRADLQVVVWESGEPDWMAQMRLGIDMHLMNAFILIGKEPPPLEELIETHPQYPEHRAKYKLAREFAKVFCHGTDYGGSARTMAAHIGRTVHETERAQTIWFGAHPGILLWHKRVQAAVIRDRAISNKFGYKWQILGRAESAFTEALAWVPQSTVACVINRVWRSLWEKVPEVEVLIQVHDSLMGQWPTSALDTQDRILAAARIEVPYDDPLVIPVGIKTSGRSWGDCQ